MSQPDFCFMQNRKLRAEYNFDLQPTANKGQAEFHFSCRFGVFSIRIAYLHF